MAAIDPLGQHLAVGQQFANVRALHQTRAPDWHRVAIRFERKKAVRLPRFALVFKPEQTVRHDSDIDRRVSLEGDRCAHAKWIFKISARTLGDDLGS